MIVDSSSISFSVVSFVSGTLVVSGILAVSGEEVGDEDGEGVLQSKTDFAHGINLRRGRAAQIRRRR